MLDVGVCCGRGSPRYFRYFMQSALDLSDCPQDLRFICALNNGVSEREFPGGVSFQVPRRKNTTQFSSRSTGHANTLNHLLARLESEYAVVCDCDVVMVRRGWDTMLRQRLGDGVVIIGTAYASEADGMPAKFRDFPNAVFSMIDTAKVRACDIDFMLRGDATVRGDTATALGRRDGDTIHLDVGCELPLKIKANGYSGIPLHCVLMNDAKAKVLTHWDGLARYERPQWPQEYQLDGEPILCHFGKSEIRHFNTDPVAKRFREDINAFNRRDSL